MNQFTNFTGYFRLSLIAILFLVSVRSFSQLTATGDTTICRGGSAQLSAYGGGVSYFWHSYPTDSSILIPQNQSQLVTPHVSTMYVVQSNITTGNLIQNGTFEQGVSGFGSDYVNNQSSIETEGTYAVVNDAHLVHPNFWCNADHTSGSGKFMAVNGANVVNVKVWYQNLPDIQPNTNYEFSAWIASLQTNNPAILQFSINGQLLGEPFHVYDSHCFWYQFYAIWNSGSNTEANISLVNQDTLISGNDFALDDISFATAIAYYDTVYVEVLPQYDSRFHRQASSCINDVTEVNYIGNAPDTANFHWNFGDAVVFSGSGPGPYEITYLTPGVHTITLWVDGYGCPSNTTTHTIAVMERPVATAYADDPVLIYGSYTTLHGSYSGGSGPFTYSWSHPELLVNPGAVNPQTVSMVSSASFILTVTDEQGNCSGYDTAVVQIVDGPLGVNLFSNPGEICPGEPSVLTAQGIGGAKSYSYSWVSDPPGFTSNLKTVTVEPTTTTIYTVTVNDGLNSFSGSITVTVEAPPVANAGLDVDIPYGTFAQLQGSASGGGGSYAYHWEPDSLVTNPDSASTQTVNLTSSTVFTLQLTDLVTGCTSQPDEVLVTMIGGPLSVVIHTDRPAICKGDTAILTAYASGGNLGNYTYSWTDNHGNNYPSAKEIQVFPTDSLIFHVTVNDGFNITDGYYTLAVHPSAEFQWAGGQDIIKACPFDTVVLKPETLPSGWQYLWSNGWVGNQITALVTGIGDNMQNYTLTVTNEYGCTFSRTAVINFDFSECTGIKEEKQDASLRILPNPNNGVFKIIVSRPEDFRNMIILSPVSGKVYEKEMSNSKEETDINLENLPSGIYILILQGPTRKLSGKLIIMR